MPWLQFFWCFFWQLVDFLNSTIASSAESAVAFQTLLLIE
jgi:hypothetical protein